MRVCVVGGGIAGLAAAWEVRNRAEVALYEPGLLGGCLRTGQLDGHLVEDGPDAFILRVPHGLQLCREAGVEGDLVHPAAGRALLWTAGSLRPLPEGLMLGVPHHLAGIATSGIISARGAARAALEPLLPRTRDPDAMTVRQLVGGRFGFEVADRLVDPLLGGIHAGSTATLSAQEVAPQLVEAARRSRSLLLALRKAAAPPGGPIFAAPRHGFTELVDALAAGLQDAGVAFPGCAVESLRARPGGGVVVEPGGEVYDAAVLAVPAPVAGGLVDDASLKAVGRSEAASVAVVAACFDDAVLPTDASGFLVPRDEGRLTTACSFASTKWPHWSDPGRSVVRLSTGRAGDTRAFEIDDGALAERLVDELGQALGRTLAPLATRVSRWPSAFPQYGVGHSARVVAAERSLAARMPSVALAGAWYRGSGIPACIASGRAAARRCLEATA